MTIALPRSPYAETSAVKTRAKTRGLYIGQSIAQIQSLYFAYF